MRYASDVEAGAIVDPAFAAFIHSAQLELDPFSEEAWRIANPDMDAARLADMKNLAQQAQRLPSLLPAFRAFVLNMPTELDERFISPVDWDACGDSAEAEPTGEVFRRTTLQAARPICAP